MSESGDIFKSNMFGRKYSERTLETHADRQGLRGRDRDKYMRNRGWGQHEKWKQGTIRVK